MKLLIVLFFIASIAVKAENVPLPSSVMGVDEIIEEFRGTIKAKIVDLGKNYITQIADQIIIFKNSENLECNGNLIAKDIPISSLRFSSSFNLKNELSEKAIYTGCNNDISLIEEVITSGENLRPLPFNDFIKGKRSFDLLDNEKLRVYKVSNGEGEEVFKLLLEKIGNSKIATFFYIGQKFLTINYEYNTSSTRANFTVYSYTASYVRKHGRWNSRSSFSPFNFSVTVDRKSADQVVYAKEGGVRLSLAGFLKLFNDYLLGNTLSSLRGIFDYHTYYFPSTEVTSSGAQSQQLLEDLRIAQNRLTTNSEINLVKNLIQDLINAAEAGQIIDNRPREK